MISEKDFYKEWYQPLGNRSKDTRGVQFIALYKGSPVINMMHGDVCFSSLFYIQTGKPCDTLYVKFFDWLWEKEDCKGFVDWVINRSFFKDVFITKDVDTWKNYGGFVDTSQDRAMMEGGLTLLRETFDENKWHWQKFRDMGYDETESYALARNYYVAESEGVSYLSTNGGNSNHHLITTNRPFKMYAFEEYKESGQNLMEGYKNERKSLSEEHFDYVNNFNAGLLAVGLPESVKISDPYLSGQIFVPDVTKTNLDLVIKTLKEKN